MRQCKLGELVWLATVPRPDICAQLAAEVNTHRGSDIYPINDLIETATGGSLTVAGWSDVANGDRAKAGRCRSGYAIGIRPTSLLGPCHILRRSYRYTRKFAKGSQGGEVRAIGKMMARVALLRDFYTPSADSPPGLFAHLRNRSVIFRRFKRPQNKVTQQICFRSLAGKRSGWLDQVERAIRSLG